ncbi:MAG: hypothetical protein Q8L51_00490 [Candidatus Amesbacteria bacterium]|nr:hypothetical protein [Candidatus Amesbacteria bacterium]
MFNIGLLLLFFLFFWFLNSGFSYDKIWLITQALFFALITPLIFRLKYIKIKHWFIFIGILYLASMILEIFKEATYSEILSSTGFGVLTILMIIEAFRRIQESYKNEQK